MDYNKIGLKAGLEIHQQLDQGKLFCHCPGYLRSEKPDFEVKRKLHAVAGEEGEVDEAVKYEATLDKEFIYQVYHDNCCLVELDEEPPKEINEKALDEALKISLLMNCEIYPIVQIMRKTVIDGSNTSGFQRTVLIGHDGYIETSYGKVRIETIALEEDSARPATGDEEGNEKTKVYKLDRLGIPLVEITTKPDMFHPEQIKEAALKIGEILRACKVKRGIGTIRQDLNISIKGHNRVEVKGFQDPKMMIEVVNKEIERQQNNIKEGKIIGEVRGATPDGSTKFNRPMPGRARMYPETDLPLLKINKERIDSLKKHLPKLKAEIRDELKKIGLNDEFINLVVDGNLEEFMALIKVYNNYEKQDSQTFGFRKPSSDANLVAKMVCLWRNEFATKFKKSIDEVKEILNERLLEEVIEDVVEGKISEGDVKTVLNKVMEGKNVEEALKIEKVDDHVLEEAIRKIVKEKPGMRANAYMGLVIAHLGKDVDKRKAMEILNKIVG